ncbi:MAG: alpha/beta fold hydrolase, partial [Mycobacterium sp.]|nr:alpha/beta fold hydrolase [Mycobacterium sp.]
MPTPLEQRIPSGDTELAAWLYLPEGAVRPPVVVMAHGLGAVREMPPLPEYAQRFTAAGMAVLQFDYRHLGASGGQPRQVVDVGHQLQDWREAIAFARRCPHVDGARVAIWGTSFAGGHVLKLAAEDHGIAAVVSQCPFVDGPTTLRRMSLSQIVSLTLLGLRDQAARLLGRPPERVALVGQKGSVALMVGEDAVQAMQRMAPPGFEESVAARIALRIGFYRPGRRSARIGCPVLVCLCEHDELTPPKATERAASRINEAQVMRWPVGHFGLYFDDPFERVVDAQTEFLAKQLAS